MQTDPFDGFKQAQRAMWASFAPTATFTTPVAAELVDFAGIAAGERVLDVGTGTGVVAITAARAGAHACGLDLTAELLAYARENAVLAGHASIVWTEGDAERLPFADASFDVVLSQFGHMFAPRPALALQEMRRVLKPGGRIAFASWPPEHFVGRLFALVARHSAAPAVAAAPPGEWGIPGVVAERLAAAQFDAPFFARGTMAIPALSLGHFRAFMERSVGPIQRLTERLADQPEALAAWRAAFDALAAVYHQGNLIRQDYLFTRAAAR